MIKMRYKNILSENIWILILFIALAEIAVVVNVYSKYRVAD